MSVRPERATNWTGQSIPRAKKLGQFAERVFSAAYRRREYHDSYFAVRFRLARSAEFKQSIIIFLIEHGTCHQ